MEANDDRKPFGNSCCAHRTVEYRNNETSGRVSLEWWECRECKSIFERKVQSESTTLRDQFAMAALTGLCASAEMTPTESRELAECAYDHADAMMEARKPK